MKKNRIRRLTRWAVLVTTTLVAAIAAFIAIDGLTDEVIPVDVAVVMGTTVNPNGSPSPWLKTRLDRALELYQQGVVTNIIVSGGLEKNGWDEASVMHAYLVGHGVPSSTIWLDRNGMDTYATAENVSLLMRARGWQSVLVVSQFYHVPRVKLALHRFGSQQVYGAHARWITWQSTIWLLREAVAYPVYFFRTY